MKLKREDNEFVSDVHANVINMVPVTAHFILFASFAFLTIALLWAHFATLDELTRGEGRVIPSKNIQVIQNLEGGIIKEILVSEGDIVEENQVLMVIDDKQHASSVREASLQKEDLKAKIVRLLAESEGTTLTFPNDLLSEAPQAVQFETDLFYSRRQEQEIKVNILTKDKEAKAQELVELKGKQKQLETDLELAEKELNMTKPLLAEGIVSEVEVLRLERSFNETKGQLDSNKLAIPRLEAGIVSAQKRIDEENAKFRTTALAELNEATNQLAQLSESSTALEDRLKRAMVRSPVKGIVNQINFATIGGIIQGGEELIEIVPLDDELLIEAKIKPSDIGGLRPNLDAMVKVTAYDFSVYGGLPGKVEHISADTIADERGETYYEIRVRTNQNFLEKNGQQFEISPGMQASVDIKTGKKSVLDYLLKPILKTKQVALTER